jgi:hypothetical protein
MNTDGHEWEGLGEEGEFNRKTGNSRKIRKYHRAASRNQRREFNQ